MDFQNDSLKLMAQVKNSIDICSNRYEYVFRWDLEQKDSSV